MVRIGIIDADSIIYKLCYRVNGTGISFDEFIPIIDKYCEEIELQMCCSHYYYVLEGEGNFRYEIDPEYKGNRLKDKPLHFYNTKDYLINNKNTIIAKNMETDDYCHIFATLCAFLSLDYAIGYIDKDLKQIIGNLYNYNKKEWLFVDKYLALYNLCTQLLTGDATDTRAAGLKGIGAVRAKKLLLDKQYNELLPTVLEEYIKFYDNLDIGVEKFYLAYKLLSLKSYDEKVTRELKALLQADDIVR